MAIQIQARRDTAANWTSANPTLAQGEFGYETDTGQMKIGDGSTAWTSLSYFGGGISDAPNDGTAYTRKSLGWSALVPSDLAQASATDGQVLTWNDSSGQWEPADSSGGGGAGLWNDGSGFIYRDGQTLVGRTTSPESGTAISGFSTFIVQSKASGSVTKDIAQFRERDGTLMTYINEDGTFHHIGTGFQVGNPNSPNPSVTIKLQGSSSSNHVRIDNSLNTILFKMGGVGNTEFTFGQFSVGNPSSANNSATFKGRNNGTTASNFQLQNENGTVGFEMFGGGRICMYLLPTSDPLRAGELWNDSGTLKVSAG